MRITQAFQFEAAHWLPRVPATHKCARMHGHSYRVEVTLAGPVRDDGMVVDFFDIEADFAAILDALDHRLLNEVEGLSNPTAETIAQWIHQRIRAPEGAVVFAVKVFETPNSWAEYRGEAAGER
ncbi:MAG: 6-carboxytetrahydropterin synthase QueD [Acetobacteraceae bacterium]|nr:6-carboxytetrahydropterin synthase QueD [Acetobacteraceae bacterium]